MKGVWKVARLEYCDNGEEKCDLCNGKENCKQEI